MSSSSLDAIGANLSCRLSNQREASMLRRCKNVNDSFDLYIFAYVICR